MHAPSERLQWNEILTQGRWEPVFQPIFSLTEGQVFAYEALSRPHDVQGRPVSILDIVEAAHAAGAETLVDATAIRAIMTRAIDMPQGAMLFVNASPFTLLDHPDALVPLAAVRGRLVIEITERAMIPEERIAELLSVIENLRGTGVLVAMDDCGAGYSGLNRLVKLRPDFAKIDMELVRGVDRDSAKAALVDAFVHFARQAGITVIAEGVETEAERDVLAELGVELIQGYLIARPDSEFMAVDPAHALGRNHMRQPAEPHGTVAVMMRLANMASRGLGDQVGLYEAVVHAARQATGADLAVLRKRTGKDLVPVAHAGPPVPNLTPVHHHAAEVSAKAVADHRTTVRQTRQEGPADSRFGSAVAAPVWLREDIWGVLAIGYDAENQIRADLVQRLTGLADQVSLILRASEHREGGRVREVLEAARYIVDHPRDWTDFWRRMLRDVEAETDAHDCWLGLVYGEEFQVITSAGQVAHMNLADWMDGGTLRGRMPPGVALREGRTVVVDDIRLEPSLAPELEGLLAKAIISAVAIPLFVGGQVVGILKAYHGAKAAFTPDRVSDLEDVALILGELIGRMR